MYNIKMVLTGIGQGDVDLAHMVIVTDHSRFLTNFIIKNERRKIA
jgi:hypothetical protein